MPFVMYVGRKPSEKDVDAGTGAVWTGLGDIKDVPAAALPKLLHHDDVWRLATDEEVAAFKGELVKVSVQEDPAKKADLDQMEREEQDKDQVIHQVNLQKLSKPALIEYAMRGFGKELDASMTIQDMRKKLRDLRVEHSLQHGA